MLGQLLRHFRRFRSDEGGAIAPAYALVIFALITMAGLGFDYGRLMALDSELQNAADQAALAAASQLDGNDGAMQRAQDAANNYFATADSPWVNTTRMSNDGKGRPITELSFRFFDGYDSATDTFGANASDDADARVVLVTVAGRKAFYALTPLVGALSSGDVTANALAGVEKSTCNVPPLMVCAPAGSDFGTVADRGREITLHNKNSGGTYDNTPGNFDLLALDYIGNKDKNEGLGLNEAAAGCFSDSPSTDPGNKTPEIPALNTRFDIYPNGNKDACDPSTGDFCPSQNVRKSWVNVQSRSQNQPLTCDATPTGTWMTVADAMASGVTLNDPGFPDDNCIISGACANVGDGVWAGDAYMAANHPGVPLSTAAPDGTRYEVYQWELADAASRLQPAVMGTAAAKGNKTNIYCSYPQPTTAPPVVPSDQQKDRRVMTVAAVDCSGRINGKSAVSVLRWIDIFILAPGSATGSDKSFTAEVIGPAQRPDGSSGFQYFGRAKAVLLR